MVSYQVNCSRVRIAPADAQQAQGGSAGQQGGMRAGGGDPVLRTS